MNTELMTNIISGKILDKKVLFIGLDGASKKIIDDMIRKKELPNIEALINTGAYFCSHSFEPVVSPVIWTSMSSGKKPEKHGIRNFYDTAKSLTAKRIWDIFNDLGFPIGVLGHFVTWPPNKVNGFIIPDILALDSKCYPERYGFMWELTNEAKNEKRTGVIKILKYIWQSYRNHIRVLTLLQAIIVSLANKTHLVDEQDRMFIWRVIKTKLHRDLFVKLLKDFSPKYSFIHIHLLDFCSHRFWKYMQPDSYENIMRNGIEHHGHKIYAAYKTIDKIVKSIRESISNDTLIVIASDHGFRGSFKTTQDWTENVTVKMKSFSESFDGVKELNFSIVFPNIHVYIRNATSEKNKYYKEFLQSIEVCEDKKPLFKIIEIDIGNFILAFNNEINDIAGKHILMDKRTVGIEEFLVVNQNFTSGIHDVNDGILILNGPEIKRNKQQGKPIGVLDIVPTILALCNLPVGSDMDGRVLTEAIEEDFLDKYPIRYINTYEDYSLKETEDNKKDLSEEEYEKVKKQLTDLGYL